MSGGRIVSGGQQKLHLITYILKSAVLLILTLGAPEVTPFSEKIHIIAICNYLMTLQISRQSPVSPHTHPSISSSTASTV